MQFIIESMALPVDNLAGMLFYAIVFMLIAGLTFGLALRFIPNPLPYILKSAIVGIGVLVSLLVWWFTIVS